MRLYDISLVPLRQTKGDHKYEQLHVIAKDFLTMAAEVQAFIDKEKPGWEIGNIMYNGTLVGGTATETMFFSGRDNS